jgi:hypothetical protein
MRKPLILAATLLALGTPPAVARPIHEPPARAPATTSSSPASVDPAPLALVAAFGAGGLLSLAVMRRGRVVRDHPVRA